jgi:hypothetical protein
MFIDKSDKKAFSERENEAFAMYLREILGAPDDIDDGEDGDSDE